MMRGFSFGSYVPGTSPVHKLDARAKLLLGCGVHRDHLEREVLSRAHSCSAIRRGNLCACPHSRGKPLRSLAPLLFIVVTASIMNLFVVQGRPRLLRVGVHPR